MAHRPFAFRLALLLLAVSFSSNALADGDNVAALKGLDAVRIYHAAQDELMQPRPDRAKAAALFTLGNLRFGTDLFCFPPMDAKLTENVGFQQAYIGSQLKSAMLDPAVLQRIVSDAKAWDPAIPADYVPRWLYNSRCPDYLAMYQRVEKQVLFLPVTLLALYKEPGYQQAYATFVDVMQDYDQSPPDGAYSPARLKAFDAARATLQSIERRVGQPFVGVMSGDGEPLGFKVIAEAQASTRIAYPGEKDDPPDSRAVHLIYDRDTFQRFWQALDAGLVPVPLPDVDFNKQMVVLIQQDCRDIQASRSFINRIEYHGGESPGLMVFLRTPVWPDMCYQQHPQVFPYAMAVLDRPAKLPASTGIDEQNFPTQGCPNSKQP